jgi:hypothetical protein
MQRYDRRAPVIVQVLDHAGRNAGRSIEMVEHHKIRPRIKRPVRDAFQR